MHYNYKHSFHLKIFIVSLFIVVPLYLYLAIATPTSDLYHYGLILNSFSAQIWQGDLMPKWFADNNAGLGSPTGIFYAPLVFYLCSLLQFLSTIDPLGFWRVLIAIHLFLMSSAYTARLWLKSEKFTPEQIDFGSILYMASPCTCVLIAITFNPANLFAITILPLALYFLNHKQLQGFALVLAALLLTHPPSFIVLAPLIFVYGYLRSVKLTQLVFSLLIAVMIAAFYLVPFYRNLEFIDYQKFTSDRFYYIFNFLTYSNLFIITASTFAMLLFLVGTFKIGNFIKLKFWYGSFFLYFWMLTPASIVLWWLIPFLQNLQFPSRFLIALIPISTYIFTYLLPRDLRAKNIENAFIVISIVSVWIIPSQLFTSKGYMENEVYKQHFVIASEYNTAYLNKEFSNYRDVSNKYSHLDKLSFLQGKGSINDAIFVPDSVSFMADITSEFADVLIKRIYFPEYDVVINGRRIEDEQLVVNHDGLMLVKLGKGQHDIQVTWKLLMSDLGCLISLLGLVIVIVQYTKKA